jgi:hypothetical protein
VIYVEFDRFHRGPAMEEGVKRVGGGRSSLALEGDVAEPT